MKNKPKETEGECTPLNESPWLCCQQVIATTIFGSTQAIVRPTMLKSEIPFNIRLNNHRKDVKRTNAINAWDYFNNRKRNFHKHGKIILIEQVNNTKNRGFKAKTEK